MGWRRRALDRARDAALRHTSKILIFPQPPSQANHDRTEHASALGTHRSSTIETIKRLFRIETIKRLFRSEMKPLHGCRIPVVFIRNR